MHSFTQETTFYGRERKDDDPENVDLHIDTDDYKHIGVDLAKVIENYCNETFMKCISEKSVDFQ